MRVRRESFNRVPYSKFSSSSRESAYVLLVTLAMLFFFLSGIRERPSEKKIITKTPMRVVRTVTRTQPPVLSNPKSKSASISPVRSSNPSLNEPKSPFLVVAIGTNPKNFEMRKGLRQSWVSWLRKDPDVVYRFFTELTGDAALDKKLSNEHLEHGDMELQDISGGYTAFSMRGQYQMRWALSKYPKLAYYLRVDDDTFLCYRKFMWELQQRPRKNFFWGKYFCSPDKHCADENFMLFSADVPRYILKKTDEGSISWLHNNTMARNFGIWSQKWPHLTIFDDRQRFDVQQGLLTKYMHTKVASSGQAEYDQFCKKHIFAHWVKSVDVMQKVFIGTIDEDPWDLPNITSNVEGCPDPKKRTIRPLYAGHRW
eukprot:IDg12671t1